MRQMTARVAMQDKAGDGFSCWGWQERVPAMGSMEGDQWVAQPTVASGGLVGLQRPAVAQVHGVARMAVGGQVTESAPLGRVLCQPLEQLVTRPDEIRAVHHGLAPGRPYGGRGMLRDGLFDFVQIALVGYGIGLGGQVLGLGGPHWVEVEHHESIESALPGHLLHAGDSGVQFFLGGGAWIEADDQQRAGSGASQGVSPLVVAVGVVNVVHGVLQVGVWCVCPPVPA